MPRAASMLAAIAARVPLVQIVTTGRSPSPSQTGREQAVRNVA